MMKPSKISNITAKVNKWICPPGFTGITIQGIVYVRSIEDLNKIMKSNSIDSQFENHELIHIRQAESTSDSWIRFYLLYVWYWLKNLPMFFIWIKAPYMFIPFELEAYSNQHNGEYSKNRCDEWKKYNDLSFMTKWKLVKEYSKIRSNGGMLFVEFINRYIKPNLK